MDLQAALEHCAHPVRKGPPCSVKQLLDELDFDDRHLLRQAMAPDGLTNAGIAKAIELAYGRKIGKYTIGRHRKRECLCTDDEAC